MGEVERLDGLAEKINVEHRAFAGSLRKTVEHGIRAGELLAEAKAQCPHGTWLPWLEQNFEGAPRTAQEYMRLYNHRDEVLANTRDSAHLSISGALRELASPKWSPSEDHELEARENNAREALARLRWHWTMDESNPGRVSFSQYAQQVGQSEREIRTHAEAYLLYTQQERKRPSLAELEARAEAALLKQDSALEEAHELLAKGRERLGTAPTAEEVKQFADMAGRLQKRWADAHTNAMRELDKLLEEEEEE